LAPELTDGRERLLARAASGQLAQAIFNAAKSEHPDARIVLRRVARVLADSSGEKTR
jgi:predicted NBD/HSP70 family sugar kinase